MTAKARPPVTLGVLHAPPVSRAPRAHRMVELPRVAVESAPKARALGMALGTVQGSVGTVAATPVATPPAAHKDATTRLRLEPPHSMRRLFRRPRGAAFMSEGSPESELLIVLSAATLSAAERAERAIGALALPADQARLVARVGDRAFGIDPLEGFWSEAEVVDALRLRLCRAGIGAGARGLRWEGFYWWAGRRLGDRDLSRLPLSLLKVSLPSLVSVHGYRRTFELIAPRLADGPLALTDVFEATRRLGLRCALAGTFAPAMVRLLLPPKGLRAGLPTVVEAGWESALLAAHAYRAGAHEAGLTHTVAGIVATVVREQVRELGQRMVAGFAPREWGAPPPSAQMELEHRHVVAALGSVVSQHWWTYWRPWPEGWCGPDVAAIERRLVKVVGDSGWPAHDVFLDDALAIAACHALQGHTPSALATLAAVKTPAVFVPVRDRLARALERGAFDRDRAPLLGSTLSRPFQGLLDRLRNTPDPAEFGSPDWRRDDLRGRLLSRLQQEGPRGLALALRTLLGPTFLDLDRFWLAPLAPDVARLAELAAWLDAQAPLVPSDRAFMEFLESECRHLDE